jgi:adenosylcobyric acid synthase
MKAIMVVGTTSHAGKSFLTAALCRYLSQQGWRVAPFKGQNMSLNAYVTASGGEIGIAQAVQAWAAGVPPLVEMNPILLKPQGDMTSQVIIKGNVVGKTTAAEYYEKYFDLGWQTIKECLAYLAMEFDLLVCEGAGSPAEINLKHRDLTNMRIATYLNAPTILVVDIDRGGSFAHVVGTLALLEPNERALIKGIVINKFRGQKSLLDSGITWLENYTGIPVIGVIPWLNQLFPAEDSLELMERRSNNKNADLTIAIIRLPHISNFTDFDPLEAEPTVRVKYVYPQDNLGYPDGVILPGTKTTIKDLLILEESGMAQQIKDYANSGGTILGICGGFQMLGKSVSDPEGFEEKLGEYEGLNLLPIQTILNENKISRQTQVVSLYPQEDLPIDGYEIHQGQTSLIADKYGENNVKYYPMFKNNNLGLVDETQSIWGCYLHGLFDNSAWRRSWLNQLRKKRGMTSLPTGIPNYKIQREEMFDNLAKIVEEYLDLTPITKF